MRFNFNLGGDSTPDDDGSPLRSLTTKEEVEWVPLQSHPIFTSKSTAASSAGRDGGPSSSLAARNLLAWDGSSRVYFWDNEGKCLHKVSVRLGEPDPNSILAASTSKILRGDVDITSMVDRISINKKGSALILLASSAVYVMYLSGRSSTEDHSIVCSTLVVGPQLYLEGRSAMRTLQVLWHPYSDNHIGILSSDSVFRLFDLSTNVVQPEQELYLQPVEPGGSRNATSICPVDFCFGGDHMWERFSVFVLFSDGAIYILCPIAPFRSVHKWESMLELYEDAYAYGLKSTNSKAAHNSKMAVHWLEAAFPELAQEPVPGSRSAVGAHPCALFDASLSLQGPLRKVHNDMEDLRIVECEGCAVSFLYNKVSKDSVLVTAWSSGQLQVDALADEIQPVWNLGSAPRVRVDSSGRTIGLAMICESTSVEQSSHALDDHLEHTIWLGQPPPVLRLAIVDLALPRKMTCDAQIMIFVDSLMPERFYALHSWGLDSVVLHFLPFTSQATSKEEALRTPSVSPVFNTCLEEMPPAYPLCGYASLSDSCGYSWLIGVSFNRDCIIVEMNYRDLVFPIERDTTKEDFDLGISEATDAPSIISKEVLGGPKAVLLPQALSSRTVAADSIEGRSVLHQYSKLFHENYLEYAHKVYLELKYHAPHLKQIINYQEKRLGETRQRLMKVEEKQSQLDERIDQAIHQDNKLDQRLQSLRKLLVVQRKPLSRAEQEFKSELDYFTGVELEALRSSIRSLPARLRRCCQPVSKGQTPRKTGLVREDQVAQLRSALEKLCLVNKENLHKVELIERATKNKESGR